jgi:hypothetical protein
MARTLGESARRRVAEKYTLADHVRLLEAVYSDKPFADEPP